MATNLEKCCKENREHLTFIFHRNGCPIISNYFILFLIKDISHILFPQNSQTPFLMSTIAKWFNNQVMCFLLHLSSPEKKSHCSNKLQKIVAIFMAKSFDYIVSIYSWWETHRRNDILAIWILINYSLIYFHHFDSSKGALTLRVSYYRNGEVCLFF